MAAESTSLTKFSSAEAPSSSEIGNAKKRPVQFPFNILIQSKIFSFLPVNEVCLAGRVSSDWLKASRSSHCWNAIQKGLSYDPGEERQVADGYGELILRVKEKEGLRPVTKEEFVQAYEIFQKYAPQFNEVPVTGLKSRIFLMREDLKKVHPRLVATFLPRTLYELIFIRKAIEEDREKERFSNGKKITYSPARNSWSEDPNANPMIEDARWPVLPKPIQIEGVESAAEKLPAIRTIAHRLNTAACEILQKSQCCKEHLSLRQIHILVEDQIHFLQDFFKQPSSKSFISFDDPLFSLSGNFAANSIEGGLKPMAVSNDKHANVIRKAVALECLDTSIGKIFFYRGGDLSVDGPIKEGKAHCISFGSGLFAGAVNDGGATAYYYMRTRDGYVLVLDPSIESSQAFLTPRLTAVESLLGNGDGWHYRLKVSANEEEISGVAGSVGLASGKHRNDPFKSPLSRSELVAKFADLKKRNLVSLT